MAKVTCDILSGETLYNIKQSFGASLSDGALSVLLTPLAVKERISNESRLETGKRIDQYTPTYFQSREITLEMHIIADSFEQLMTYRNALIEALSVPDGVTMNVHAYGKNLFYNLHYLSCTQFAQYETLAKFAIRFVEPKPNDGKIYQ